MMSISSKSPEKCEREDMGRCKEREIGMELDVTDVDRGDFNHQGLSRVHSI
ncbi:hypothetical protein TIFTF001_022003 [Ficus carica]|uniref:Uncharacterized protein n=1 Tax=Ficus carica TaxID=3494 RepID=A0AA88AJ39_FICCA|nr:hypothetical protein TIFTF001_022003 [Ficus carica]